jgi:vesicle-fusing ATPase
LGNYFFSFQPFNFNKKSNNRFDRTFFLLNFSTTLDPSDSDAMAREFLAQNHHMIFTVGQQLVLSFQEKKLQLIVKELEGKEVLIRIIPQYINIQPRLWLYFFFSLIFIFILSMFLVADVNAMRAGCSNIKTRKINIGQCFPNTMIVFDKAEGSSLSLLEVGKSKGYYHEATYIFCFSWTCYNALFTGKWYTSPS